MTDLTNTSLAPIREVYETVLYGPDIPLLAAFYSEALGLRLLREAGPSSAVFRLGPNALLLLFDPAFASQAGRGAPTHGAVGPGHAAFVVKQGELELWRGRLEQRGLVIELDVRWPPGGRSIYVRDPAGNSVELVEGQVWPDS